MGLSEGVCGCNVTYLTSYTCIKIRHLAFLSILLGKRGLVLYIREGENKTRIKYRKKCYFTGPWQSGLFWKIRQEKLTLILSPPYLPHTKKEANERKEQRNKQAVFRIAKAINRSNAIKEGLPKIHSQQFYHAIHMGWCWDPLLLPLRYIILWQLCSIYIFFPMICSAGKLCEVRGAWVIFIP